MDISAQVIITMICGIAFGYHMWKQGLREGGNRLLDILHEEKIIAYDHKGDIKPNPFWQESQEED